MFKLIILFLMICAIPFFSEELTHKSITVRTTYYNPVSSQCSGNPLVTADGSKISLQKLKNGELKWVAISRDLLKQFPHGSKIKVVSKKHPEINGVYEIHDTMGPKHTYSIDILAHQSKGHLFGAHLVSIRKVK